MKKQIDTVKWSTDKLNVRFCYEEHRKAVENWDFGNLLQSQLDADGNLCIRYEKGWFHYKLINGQVTWW